jgi:hypothetical protein
MTATSSPLQRAVKRALMQTPGRHERAAQIIDRRSRQGDVEAMAAAALAWADFFERFDRIIAAANDANAEAAFAGTIGAMRHTARGEASPEMLDIWRKSCRATAVSLFVRYDDPAAAAAAFVVRSLGEHDGNQIALMIWRPDGPRAPAMRKPDARLIMARIVDHALGKPCQPMPPFVAPHRVAESALGEAIDLDHLERRVAAEQRAIRRGWKEFRS